MKRVYVQAVEAGEPKCRKCRTKRTDHVLPRRAARNGKACLCVGDETGTNFLSGCANSPDVGIVIPAPEKDNHKGDRQITIKERERKKREDSPVRRCSRDIDGSRLATDAFSLTFCRQSYSRNTYFRSRPQFVIAAPCSGMRSRVGEREGEREERENRSAEQLTEKHLQSRAST